MQNFLKTQKSRLWLLTAPIFMMAGITAQAQAPADVSNTSNYGTASWGVGTGADAFNVSGPYDATANTAEDYFYDATGSGTPIEISGNTAPGFYDVVLDNGTSSTADITNTAGIDVSNSLQLLNGITTTTNTVTGAIRLGATATTSGSGTFGSTRYVDGYMGKEGSTSFSYPVGDEGFYAPVTMSDPSGTTLRYSRGDPGNTTALSTTQGINNLATVSTMEYYPCTNSTTPAGSTMTITYNEGAMSGIITDPSSLTIAGFNGTEWVNLSVGIATIDLINRTVTITLAQGLSGITMFTLGSTTPSNPLPIELSEFFVTKTADGIDAQLNWTVLMEQGITFYKIERSSDGIKFVEIGETIAATGTNNGAAKYQAFDRSPLKGNNYYRLLITNSDGTVTYSPIRLLNFAYSNGVVNVYPNPSSSELFIDAADAGNGKVRIYSAGTGALLIETLLSKEGTAHINVSQLASGTYIVRVSNEGETVMANEKVNVLH